MEVVGAALAGKLVKEKRLVLNASVTRMRKCSTRKALGNAKERVAHRENFLVVNDCVIRTGKSPRMLELDILLEHKHFLAKIRGDGLIVATPTGSTAYALSSGGPIVEPELKANVVAPICPHSLNLRPLLLDARRDLRIILKAYHQAPSRAVVFFDGQVSRDITNGDAVDISIHPKSLVFLRGRKRNYFDLLRTKLKWSA
ncbi:NAD(+)/NADH kinase [Elusimicrobiota bacterium]